MFCKYCGAQMSDEAKFCPECGKGREIQDVQDNNVNSVDDNQIILEVKPTFNIPYKLCTTIGNAILILIIIGLGIIDLVTLWRLYPISIGITIAIVFFYIVIKMFFDSMQYDDMEYNFYRTKVEYKDGFLNKEQKELKYKYIREVTMNQNILERLFNIGTIRIFTNASSMGYTYGNRHNNMRGRNGIYIHCVENVQEKYKEIKEIIDQEDSEE